MKIAAQNFKILEEKQYFEIKPFTIITGPNGSGKSTFTELFNIVRDYFLNCPPIELTPQKLSTNKNSEIRLENWKNLNRPISFYIKERKLEKKYDYIYKEYSEFSKETSSIYLLNNVEFYLNEMPDINLVKTFKYDAPDVRIMLDLKEINNYLDNPLSERDINSLNEKWHISISNNSWDTPIIEVINKLNLPDNFIGILNQITSELKYRNWHDSDFSFKYISNKLFHYSILRINDHDELKLVSLQKDITRQFWIDSALLRMGIGQKLIVESISSDFVKLSLQDGDLITPINELSKGLQNCVRLIIYLSTTFWLDPSSISDISLYTIIEEPETSLHPKLQSRIADLLSMIVCEPNGITNYATHYIIETHSEYLIRKLQYLSAKNEIDPKFISIYYFPDKIENGIKMPYEITINKNGTLSEEFGSGFIDESDKIAIDLFMLEKIRNN